MKRMITFLIVILLFFSPLRAEQPERATNCFVWMELMSGGFLKKFFYLDGFREGMAAMATINGATEQQRQEAMNNVWSDAVTVADVVILIDEHCKHPGNNYMPIMELITKMTRTQRH